jgi:hypothetical protein
MGKPYFLIGLLALSAASFVGCDSNDDEDGDVFGLWFSDQIEGDSGDAYVDVSADELVTYILIDVPEIPDFETCYVIESVDVVSRDGDEWVVEDAEGERYEATLRVDDDELVVTAEGETVRFVRSSVDVGTLTPECEDGTQAPR